jgi:group I intron endonuclease
MTQFRPFFNTIEIFIGCLHLAEIQLITKKELKKKSGIYGFMCRTSNKIYIGSSIDLSFRFNQHLKDINSNIKLQNAINKYTLKDFIFLVFEHCEAKDLITREQFYMDRLKPEFNINPTTGSSLGTIHSEETKAKMSEALSGENHPMFGKTHIAETLVKLSEANKGGNNPFFGKTHSIETKIKISKAKKEISISEGH